MFKNRVIKDIKWKQFYAKIYNKNDVKHCV